MKVQLIQPTVGDYVSNSRSGCYPPLGLISIATYVRQQCPGVVVEILDGEVLSADEILDRMDADIVALSTNTVTYPQALHLAEHGKKRGARVVLGGVYASALPERILRIREDIVDCVVVGYGEKPMVDIIRGDRSRLLTNQVSGFGGLPAPDRRLVDIDAYADRFKTNHPTWGRRGSHVFTNVGCRWREETGGGCIFCSRSGMTFSHKSPAAIWKEVRQLVTEHGIEYIIDFSDSILQDLGWLSELVASRPKDIDVPWHVFGRIDEIDTGVLEMMRRLPCTHMFVGIESGDDACYLAACKGGGSPAESLVAVRRLAESGIGITPSYVVGLPGETESSLERTLAHAKHVHEIAKFEEIFCCELIPFPGSRAFDMLAERVSLETDVFEIEALKRLWAKSFTNVDVDVLSKYVDAILALGSYTITIRAKSPCPAEAGDPGTPSRTSVILDDR